MKKKTIIWEENNEPPKNYIWMKPDGKAYEYSYVTRKWEESNLIEKKEEEDQLDPFIQECIDTMISGLVNTGILPESIENLDDLKRLIENENVEIDQLLMPAELMQSMIASLPETTTVTITGDNNTYAYIIKDIEMEESAEVPTSLELVSVNEEHYNQLVALLIGEDEEIPTPTPIPTTLNLENFDIPITYELRFISENDIASNNVYDANEIVYISNKLPKGTENGQYYCLYGFLDMDRSQSNFLLNHNITNVNVEELDLTNYEIHGCHKSNNVGVDYENGASWFLNNFTIYQLMNVKYADKNVYLIKITPTGWSAGIYIPIIYYAVT